MDLSIIIPAYKNKKQLLDNLKHNWELIKNCEIIIVNDDPSSSLASDLKKYKKIILIENSKNMGFGTTVNIGAHQATHNYMMFLNTDVLLYDDTFKKAFKHFESEPKLFGVSFAQKERDGSIVGKNVFFWEKGFFNHRRVDNNTDGFNGWAEGGSCIVDRNKFLKISGFDQLYAPFYWEDIDLSYRAWKSGYKVVYDPKILVEHHHESTIGKYFTKNFVRKIAFRNQLTFIWKNISSFSFFVAHTFYLSQFLLISLVKRKWYYFGGFIAALMRLPVILARRSDQKKLYKKSDKEVMNIIHG